MDAAKGPHGQHEQSDVSVVSVTKFGLGITAFVLVCLMLMWFLFDWFAGRETATTPKPAPLAAENPRKEPPEPRLQAKPLLDLRQFRADEDSVLTTYGWVDPDRKIVRIPIHRAIDMVAKEGLASRPRGGVK